MKGFLSRVLRYSFLVVILVSKSVSADTRQSGYTQNMTEREALNELLALVNRAPRPDGNTQGWPIALPSDWCPCDDASLKALLVQIRDSIGLPSCDCDTVFNCLCAIKALVEAGGASNIDVIESYVEAINSKIDNLDVNITITSLTTLESKLDACCFTLNNKLDAIYEDTESILENLNVVVDVTTLESKLDLCCTTLNSKLDVLDTEVGVINGTVNVINGKVDVLDDKIDLLGTSIGDVLVDTTEIINKEDQLGTSIGDVLADTSIIESQLDSCCFTVNSKLDVLDAEVGVINGKIDVLDDKIDQLGTSIGDVLVDTSIIESQLDACCFTVNSKLDVIDAEVGVINGKIDVLDDKVDQLGTSIGDVLAATVVIENKLDQLGTSIGDVLVDTTEIINKEDQLGTSIGDVLAATVVIENKLDQLGTSIGDVLVDTTEIINKEDQLGTSIGDVLVETSIIESLIDSCCYTSNSKLDMLLDDAFTIESKIDLLVVNVACEPTPITSANIVSGVITLAMPGNYCLSTDLTATVSIVADNVHLCLNNRELTGAVEIFGAQATLENGFVTAPGNSPDVDAVIKVNTGAIGTVVTGVTATAENATISIAGRDALAIIANGVFVEKSTLKSGSAGLGNGGHGIHCIAPCQRAVIRSVDIIGTGSGTTGNGGDGVYIDSGCASIEIRNCTIAHTGISSGGNAGIAINDQHAALPANYSSVILNNMAYDIANTSTVYEIRNLGAPGASQGVSITVGTPGLYDNVYLP